MPSVISDSKTPGALALTVMNHQGGGDPTIHRFTWTGGAWRYDGCVGVGYYEQVR
ncbi:hypothetical protein [Dietzia sp. E1]|uniref:hypothetical protein n=1 Tax=Dietzia sp. E1 TaxID=328361 RepID=UPI001F50A68B|nr:hypothetical protein [Dietzia sp. E1]